MATSQSASMVLFSLLGTVILFVAFAGISKLNILDRHAYVPEVGWQWPSETKPPSTDNWEYYDTCQNKNKTSGFPLADWRGAASAVRCLHATNPLASGINYALYFAAAAILSTGIVIAMKERGVI